MCIRDRSYPIDHIEKIVRPVSAAPAAKNVIFLSADAFGVLPPVSVLTPEQTEYYFLSGFTAKLAGTERGITEPTPTFSACFGQAFLELHPTKYAEELVKRMKESLSLIHIFVAFLIALFTAFLQNPKLSFGEKMKVITAGAGEENIITMCLIFLCAGGFSGAVTADVSPPRL